MLPDRLPDFNRHTICCIWTEAWTVLVQQSQVRILLPEAAERAAAPEEAEEAVGKSGSYNENIEGDETECMEINGRR